MSRVEEALLLAEDMKISKDKSNCIFFQTTLEKLLEATENLADANKRVRKLIESAMEDHNFAVLDVEDSVKWLYEENIEKTNKKESKRKYQSFLR